MDLSPKEVAAQLGVHVKTVLREIRDGRLRAYHIRRSIRIRPKDVARYREQRRSAWNVGTRSDREERSGVAP